MELLAFGKTGWGDELFYATLMTIAVSITAMLIGFLFALIFTPLKLSKYKSLNLIGNFYTTVIRGVPELLVIYLFFFGGSGAIMFVASMFGYYEYIEINAFITGSFAIGIISGAYSTEVFRGAIQSIDRGQFEAAKVLGIKKVFIAELANTAIDLMKETYPVLLDNSQRILREINLEETRFLQTLERGEKLLNELIASGKTIITGKKVFELYE